MIISDKYKYLFIEVPHTASTSISEELRTQYDGRYFGTKHATYTQFLKVSNEEQKRYFVFGGIRNPLDVAVTTYLKYKTNHGQRYEGSPGEPKVTKPVTEFQMSAYRFTQQHEFPAYFRRYHQLPYSDAISREVKKYAQFVIRYEYLQEDFAELLKRLGIEPIRPLPHVNRTATKQRDYLSYYTPELQTQAARVFAPYMEEWGYTLPDTWNIAPVSPIDRLRYRMINGLRDFYWQHIKISPRFYGRLARRVK